MTFERYQDVHGVSKIDFLQTIKIGPESLDRPAPRKPRPEGRGQGELYKNGNLPYREAPPGRAGRLH